MGKVISGDLYFFFEITFISKFRKSKVAIKEGSCPQLLSEDVYFEDYYYFDGLKFTNLFKIEVLAQNLSVKIFF